MRFSEKELVAYHEAGHALISFLKKIRIIKISIIPDEQMMNLGYLLTSNKLGVSEDEREYREKLHNRFESIVMLAMAGEISEYVLSGTKQSFWSSHDRMNIHHILTRLTYSEVEYRLYSDILWARTEDIIRKKENWNMLSALANHLLTKEVTLSGKKTWKIFKENNQTKVKQDMQNIQESITKLS